VRPALSKCNLPHTFTRVALLSISIHGQTASGEVSPPTVVPSGKYSAADFRV